jgi:GNAT superfamily N-acetyltransferase
MTEHELKNTYIRLMQTEDSQMLAREFSAIGWNKTASLFESYMQDQRKGNRYIWLAFQGESFAGYVTLLWESKYSNFSNLKIPETSDLNVLPHLRGRGIASQLLNIAEEECVKRSKVIGIGVGLYADYGAAQRIYVKRGYIPDGHGITYNYEPISYGTFCAS